MRNIKIIKPPSKNELLGGFILALSQCASAYFLSDQSVVLPPEASSIYFEGILLKS
jgi:hypothetical protein